MHGHMHRMAITFKPTDLPSEWRIRLPGRRTCRHARHHLPLVVHGGRGCLHSRSLPLLTRRTTAMMPGLSSALDNHAHPQQNDADMAFAVSPSEVNQWQQWSDQANRLPVQSAAPAFLREQLTYLLQFASHEHNRHVNYLHLIGDGPMQAAKREEAVRTEKHKQKIQAMKKQLAVVAKLAQPQTAIKLRPRRLRTEDSSPTPPPAAPSPRPRSRPKSRPRSRLRDGRAEERNTSAVSTGLVFKSRGRQLKAYSGKGGRVQTAKARLGARSPTRSNSKAGRSSNPRRSWTAPESPRAGQRSTMNAGTARPSGVDGKGSRSQMAARQQRRGSPSRPHRLPKMMPTAPPGSKRNTDSVQRPRTAAAVPANRYKRDTSRRIRGNKG